VFSRETGIVPEDGKAAQSDSSIMVHSPCAAPLTWRNLAYSCFWWRAQAGFLFTVKVAK